MDPIKDGIEAAKNTAAQKPGDISFSAWLNGPVKTDDSSSPPKGVTVGVLVTIIF
jgi:hypothetical protein